MDYYSKKLYLAQVDENDILLARVERWRAHEKGVLHRGFTIILMYNNLVVLQHRKHPAFDGFYDLSFSSHPVYVNNRLQTMEQAIYNALEREWNLEKSDLITDLKYLNKFYYKAKDPNSIYTEHEVDYLYLTELNKLPNINKDFAYGYEMIDISNFKFKILNFQMAPWVKKINLNKFF